VRARIRLFLILLASVGLPGHSAADLKSYFAKPEPAYAWEKKGEQVLDGVTVVDLQMTSQEWQGMKWTHRLQVFRPEKPKHARFCAILNTGGGGSNAATLQGAKTARETGATYAILHHIPNQPIFGKTEDALIVVTWMKYLETGDDSWPLHFPMAKACLKAMDTIQAYSKQVGWTEIDQYLITGGSKRGWTTWLAAASEDPRIKGIAPMVIDILNVTRQIPHQIASYGRPSEQVGDYTAVGMEQILTTPRGQELLKLEDPYFYLDRLTLPKLLVLGTNDRYWSQDALNLYWDDLKGPKWVLYTPNSGHGLEDRARVYATLNAFIEHVASGRPWPKPTWEYAATPKGIELVVGSDRAPKEVCLFTVNSKTRDFRDSKWWFVPVAKKNGAHRAEIEIPAEGFRAAFGEIVYEIGGREFTLSTQLQILGPSK
jgi:PhoPQ-activated pathogenicity-related protein